MATLTLKVTNKNQEKLRKISEWVNGLLDEWQKDAELPMKGTEWDSDIK
jgi:hypothetical protein